jgi:hypothetical protein
MTEQQPRQCDCGEFHGSEACPWETREEDDPWQVEQLAETEQSDVIGRL